MGDLSSFCCLNAACVDLGKRGHGNLTVTARYGPNKTRPGRFADRGAHVGPDGANPRHQVFQVVVGTEGSRRRAVPQAEHHERVVLGAGDDEGQVPVLLVEGVEQGELLLPTLMDR